MQKRAVIVHCWGATPQDNWYLWLKKELEKKGYQVEVPQMPETEWPKIETWVPHLEKIVGTPDKKTILIGHSIGCQTVLRYVATLKKGQEIGGVICVAGWFVLKNIRSAHEKQVAAPWLETPLDEKEVKVHSKKIVALFSDDDPYVTLENKNIYEKRFGAATTIIYKYKHVECTQVPELLRSIQELSL